MQDLLNEVQMMRHSGYAPQLNEAWTLLFEEIRDLAVTELAAALARVLDRNKSELLELAGRNPSRTLYCLYMDTWEQVKAQQETLTQAFGRRLLENLGDAWRHAPRERGMAHANPNQLGLVAPEDLEMTLASNTVSHALRLACADELRVLDNGMQRLLDSGRQPFDSTVQDTHPLSPEMLGEALMEAIRGLEASNQIKLLLVTRLNAHLPAEVKSVYQRINKLLLTHGFTPILPHAVRSQGKPVAPGPDTAAKAATPRPQPTAPGPQADMYAMLQQLMSMGRIGASPVSPGELAGHSLPSLPGLPGLPDLPGQEAANESVADAAQTLGLLTRIQHGELEHLPGGPLDPKVVHSGAVNVLRVIKHTGAAGSLAPMDAMTLDIVALIFDYILDDARLPDSMKALIGRLQIPVLKVAMLDKTFFSQKSHPARRFLDLLADAALGWNPQEGHGSLFYQTVDTLVQQVLNEFEDRVEVFTEALESLRSFIDLEKRQADERSCLHAQLVQQTEQLALVHSLAVEAIQTRCLNHSLPDDINRFLLGPWANYLASIYHQEGRDGGDWGAGLATVDDLVWSLAPKIRKEERQQLVSLLPSLLKRLDDGMNRIQVPREERDAFYSHLVKHHSDAVKLGLQGKSEAEPAADSGARLPHPGPVFKYDSPELHDVPLPDGQVEADARILREISTIASPLDEETPVIDLEAPVPEPPANLGDITYYEQQVSALKRGAWLEFQLDDDTALRAKLAWVSPLRGTYLFTNRLGERAVSINAAGLAQKLRDGQARFVDNTALIDRAVSSVFERLRKPS